MARGRRYNGYVSHCTHNTIVGVGASKGAAGNVREAMAALDLSLVGGRSVLVKPNAGRMVKPESGVNTSPGALAGCLDALMSAGASSVAVGESPILGVNAREAMELCGMGEVARERGAELIDLDEAAPETLDLPPGAAIESVKICGRIREFDVVVSLGVMKTHMHTGVSLSLKNVKGMLYRKEKVRFHQLPGKEQPDGARPLDIAVADLLTVLRPDIGVVDGWVGLEGLGPSAGTPKKLDAATASLDPVAADAVACRLMGIDPLSVAHVSRAAVKGVGTADLAGIRVVPEDYERFASPFARPPQDLALAFPDVVIYEAGACSACLSTAMLFLQRFADRIREYHLEDGKLHIALGSDVEDVPAGTIVIGNCAATHAKKGPFARGCPPVASRIYEAVTGREPDGPTE